MSVISVPINQSSSFSLRSVLGLPALLAYFVGHSELKILCHVKDGGETEIHRDTRCWRGQVPRPQKYTSQVSDEGYSLENDWSMFQTSDDSSGSADDGDLSGEDPDAL